MQRASGSTTNPTSTSTLDPREEIKRIDDTLSRPIRLDPKVAAEAEAARAAAPAPVPIRHRGGPSRLRAAISPRAFFGMTGAAVLLLLLPYWGYAPLRRFLSSVSTDDAYVTGHVTYLSSRIEANVLGVSADDSQFVKAGEVIVQLDPAPFEIQLRIAEAQLDREKMQIDARVAKLESAQAELQRHYNVARSLIAAAHETVHLISSERCETLADLGDLDANVARFKLEESRFKLALKDYERARALIRSGSVSRESLDDAESALGVAEQHVEVARRDVFASRGLLNLGYDFQLEIPSQRHIERHPAILSRMMSACAAIAELGGNHPPLTSDLAIEDFCSQLQRALDGIDIEKLPRILAAKAEVDEILASLGGDRYDPRRPYDNPDVHYAEQQVADAKLNLSYTKIVAPFDGFIVRRTTNPGNRVHPGQSLMGLRSLKNVWIEANFKETQIAGIRIGQRVDIVVDAYPNTKFEGRVAGFSAGTGSTLALLPPENATGNFIKIVQRLPVRIELSDPPDPETPLFVGLSCVPYVQIYDAPEGAFAGQMLTGPSSLSTLESPPAASSASQASPEEIVAAHRPPHASDLPLTSTKAELDAQ